MKKLIRYLKPGPGFLKRLRNQRGTFVVTAALFATPMLGVAGLTTDVGMAWLARTELSLGADNVALATIKKFASSTGEMNAERLLEIRNAAKITGEQNSTRNGNHINVSTSPVTNPDASSGIVFGFYNQETEKFTGYTDSQALSGDHIVNAIRARVTMGEGQDEPFTFRFARFIDPHNESLGNMVFTSESIATFGLMNIVPIFDISASMDNQSYRPVEQCEYSELPTKWSRWFHFAARNNASGVCENDIDQPAIGAVHGDYGVVMPEPITSVFEITRDVLLERNALFQGLYRGGLLVYETTAYAPYSPSGSVELSSTSMSNKANIQAAINHSIDTWREYANVEAEGGQATHTRQDFEDLAENFPNLAFPGGLNPPETTYTNTGDAIFKATSWILNANQETKTQSTDVIILFSDGLPNCYRLPSNDPKSANFDVPPQCPRMADIRDNVEPTIAAHRYLYNTYFSNFFTQEEIEGILNNLRETMIRHQENLYELYGGQWALANANLAAEYDIQIQSIYFGTDEDGGCDPRHPSAGFSMLNEIAERTGGKGYCAENIAQLTEIFEELSTKQSFVLVHEAADDASGDHEEDGDHH